MTPDLTDARILDIVVERAALKIISTPIGTPDADIAELARDMLATMYAAPGIGLAAIQVGRPVRMIVYDAGDAPEIMIDPIVEWSKKLHIDFEEGCLSIPGRRMPVSRPAAIKVSYTDLSGERHVRELGGLPARIVQHEIDHLDGILMPERAG